MSRKGSFQISNHDHGVNGGFVVGSSWEDTDVEEEEGKSSDLGMGDLGGPKMEDHVQTRNVMPFKNWASLLGLSQLVSPLSHLCVIFPT